MGKKENKTPGAGEVQIFELTMDNPEDQDELNRQLRKPGELADDVLPVNVNVAAISPALPAADSPGSPRRA
jgi:hypothetical protein